ncbi:MAG: carbamoyltransferase HypF [Actinobacteria bacterium]|nr:carbamoyltransferase HypF [Actinomycetota bacterium]
MSSEERVGRLLEVSGVVQGVGFRPFVWRLADRHGVSGRVRNLSGIVEIVAEGSSETLDRFTADLAHEAPPRARVEEVRWRPRDAAGLDGFAVDESGDDLPGERLVPPDVATCPACLRELLDPDDRRFGHAFVNCTDCGPRYTIIGSLPYDRARTSMGAFELCPDCAAEYSDPSDRRFHAEPVACPACGPGLWLADRAGHRSRSDPIEAAVARLCTGGIVAVKGLGGFHLACDATDEAAVAKLRRRKGRPEKPLAVMVESVERARDLAGLSPAEEEALASWRAPVVLVRDLGKLAPNVAPGHRRTGLMLPSTPLHHLLLRGVAGPLVMTSGNRTDEPLCTGNDEAMERLSGIADAFLLHDRDVVARVDDSVVRVALERPVVMRRARGYVPEPVTLPLEARRAVLAVGAELNATFCLAGGDRAWLSPHVGTLGSEEDLAAYAETLDRYRDLLGIEPEVVAHDLHPDFLSTRFARETGLPTTAVQHHHAHVAAVMAEHGLSGPVIGLAFDGFGLGDDGEAWGGEFLLARWDRAERLGHLRRVRQPGGDAAVRDPTRMAIAHAADAGVLEQALGLLAPRRRKPGAVDEVEVVLGQIASGLGSPMTSSAGRLFDAVAALAGVCRSATYDGQPAILLEQVAESSATFEYGFEIDQEDGRIVVDTRPTIQAVVRDLVKGRAPGEVAGRFHRTLTAAVLAMVRLIGVQTGVRTVVLAGGVFDNDLLLSDVAARLRSFDFQVHAPHEVPVGDGGLSLGQALVAAARDGEG